MKGFTEGGAGIYGVFNGQTAWRGGGENVGRRGIEELPVLSESGGPQVNFIHPWVLL